ncbi:hypothetical protein [Falsiroseomonas sp. E2-1-a4]|uniref:hypothetical protein n=1 Tax=Falsiroseomonas sp. E2-1-a4 TaxID=3239299 RepID=UPI003F405E33
MTATAATHTATILAACESKWEANKADCSGFVRAVARACGLELTGQANTIIQHVRTNWHKVTDGADACAKATAGNFVIGGLEATPNGHVVVVVPGPLNRGKYPTAYWGSIAGVGKKNTTINWSWGVTDRDKVEYRSIALAADVVAGGLPMRIIGWRAPKLPRIGFS